MLVASHANARNYWNQVKASAEYTSKLSWVLYEIQDKAYYGKSIEFSPQSLLKHIDFDGIDPKKVFEYIDFEKQTVDEDTMHMDSKYWDFDSHYGWKLPKGDEGKRPKTAILEYLLAYGGPNADISFYHKLNYYPDDPDYTPEIELEKIQFEYSWWSPLYTIDITDDEHAIECYQQIIDYSYELFETDYELHKENKWITKP